MFACCRLHPYLGAYAVDSSGPIPVRLLTPIPVNFTRTITTESLVLIYVATSSVGQFTSNVTRDVTVFDPCTTATSLREFTCNTTLKCSVNTMYATDCCNSCVV